MQTEYNTHHIKERADHPHTSMEITTNKTELAGSITDTPVLSHSVFGENFYSAFLEIKRLSDRTDIIPLTLPEKTVHEHSIKKGTRIHFQGQLRSYNYYLKVEDLGKDKKSRLVVTSFCKAVLPYTEDINSVMLDGFICKPPIYRVTPFGKQITDILVAINRNYGKSDYIPVIYWGNNAQYASSLVVGSHISVFGRLQSRNYEKRLPDGSSTTKTTYEVSGFQLKIQKDD